MINPMAFVGFILGLTVIRVFSNTFKLGKSISDEDSEKVAETLVLLISQIILVIWTILIVRAN